MTIFAPQFAVIGFCGHIRKNCASTLVEIAKFQKVIHEARSNPYGGLFIRACIRAFGDAHEFAWIAVHFFYVNTYNETRKIAKYESIQKRN